MRFEMMVMSDEMMMKVYPYPYETSNVVQLCSENDNVNVKKKKSNT